MTRRLILRSSRVNWIVASRRLAADSGDQPHLDEPPAQPADAGRSSLSGQPELLACDKRIREPYFGGRSWVRNRLFAMASIRGLIERAADRTKLQNRDDCHPWYDFERAEAELGTALRKIAPAREAKPAA